MGTKSLSELQSIALNDDVNASRALLEISARVEEAMVVLAHYRKIGFTVDAEVLEKTIGTQQRFLEYAASLDK